MGREGGGGGGGGWWCAGGVLVVCWWCGVKEFGFDIYIYIYGSFYFLVLPKVNLPHKLLFCMW